jgi:hypothetical protein
VAGLTSACEGQIGDVGGAATASDISQTKTGTIVPLYTSPRDGTWNAVIAAKQAHPAVPVLAVINPATGPGEAVSGAHVDGIARLCEAGVKVIGYVPTNYGARAEADVRADIDRWRAFYPRATGVFFDQQVRRSGSEDYYRGLADYARSVGLDFSVGNPGVNPAASYVGVVDTILVYERPGMPDLGTLSRWKQGYPRQNFGIIPYGTAFDAAYVKSVAAYVGYIYLTDNQGPNPWDSVPLFFGDLLAALE